MQRSLFGVLLGTVLVIAVAANSGSSEPVMVGPSEFAPPRPGPSLVSHVTARAGGPQVIVIDTQQRVMAVYHVDQSSGEITLKSVRNMTWDLQMLEFNSGEPSPQQIRDMHRELQP